MSDTEITAESARDKGHWDGAAFGRDPKHYASALETKWYATRDMHPRYVYFLVEHIGLHKESEFRRVMPNYVPSPFDEEYAVAFWNAACKENAPQR